MYGSSCDSDRFMMDFRFVSTLFATLLRNYKNYSCANMEDLLHISFNTLYFKQNILKKF